MKIPNRIKIGGHDYKVKFHDESDICSDGADCGSTNRSKGIIEINSSLMKSEQEATFFHEIFHVMNSIIEHDLLDSLSQQIYQVLKDNKMLK